MEDWVEQVKVIQPKCTNNCGCKKRELGTVWLDRKRTEPRCWVLIEMQEFPFCYKETWVTHDKA